MDNLCHTLVGAALAEAGLKRRTALGTAALVLGANLPDVDVLSYAWGPMTALGFRRGWTHGLPALLVWPFVLTGILLAWDRLVRRRRRPQAEPADPRALLPLAVISILTHPFLDWMNTYGMRWLMPFRDAWSYGDVLFIVDPWIWLALGAGWWWSRRRSRRDRPSAQRPARMALALVGVYIAMLWGASRYAAGVARQELAEQGIAADRVMAGPLPLDPFQRQIVAATAGGYARAIIDWRRRPAFVSDAPAMISRGDRHRAVAQAAATREGSIFLHWARFPFFQVEESPHGWIVRMTDARYTIHPGTGFGRLTVEVPR